jgi:GxxExxY protein
MSFLFAIRLVKDGEMSEDKGVLNAGTQGRRDAGVPENILSGQIRKAAIEVHRLLGGPGLLESIYEGALFQELQLQGILVRRQVPIPVTYKGITMHDPMRLDLLVGEKVIIEVKAVEKNNELHKAQLLTYLRLTNLKLGLVLNFGQATLLDGLTRVVNGL